jgi:hypothetical protein
MISTGLLLKGVSKLIQLRISFKVILMGRGRTLKWKEIGCRLGKGVIEVLKPI